MSNSVKLSLLAEELSCVPYPVCGKCHKVSFEKVDVSMGLQPLWFPVFEGGTCEGFKVLVRVA